MFELPSSLPQVDWVRLTLVYLHLLSCAVALALVASADLRILTGTFRIDALRRTAHHTTRALLALWLTGLALVYCDTGFDPATLVTLPKLLLKFLVVATLTLNGMLLHVFSFPMIARGSRPTLPRALLLAVTGALSTSHWLLAAFVGVARPLAHYPLEALLVGYAIYCAAALCAAIVCVQELRRLLSKRRAISGTTRPEEPAEPLPGRPGIRVLPANVLHKAQCYRIAKLVNRKIAPG